MGKLKKGVWLHDLQQFSGPPQVREFVRKYADAGFDLLIPCVKNGDGLLDYQSRVGNVRPVFKSWDPLEVMAHEAKRQGIKVHAWYCNSKESVKSKLLQMHPNVAALDRAGKKVVQWGGFFVCLARPEVRRYEAAIMKEVVDNYDIAGVHFDYIRLGDGVCYCPVCRKELKTLEGIKPEKLWRGSRVPAKFMKWRCDNVTALVRDVSAHARRGKKEVSAAVFCGVPEAILYQGQDFVAWSEEGLLDLVIPMNYSNSPWIMKRYLINHMAQNKRGKAELWEGLGLYCMDNVGQFAEQVRTLKKDRIKGVVIFEHNSLKAAHFKILSRY